MTDIAVKDQQLHVRLRGLDIWFAFRRKFNIPLEHVLDVSTDTPSLKEIYKGIRLPGTHIPGIIAAGTFFKNGFNVFWNVKIGESALRIDLVDEPYHMLILGVRDRDEVISRVNQALSRRV